MVRPSSPASSAIAGATSLPVLADHHDQVLRRHLGDRVQRVGQHAAARQCVQHLGGIRTHAGTRPGRQDQDRGLTMSCQSNLRQASSLKLRRQDSNLNYLNQNQRCCRLHHDGLINSRLLVERRSLKGVAAPDKEVRAPRARMTGAERRHQLIDIARSLFAERGYEGTAIEEIAQRANVSKPVVYEHFGGKEGLYAVVVDREMSALLDGITSSLTRMTNNRSRLRIERVALALLTYVDERTDGFRILIRDSPAAITSGGTYSTLLNEAVNQVSSILAGDFSRRGLDPDMAPLYAQALVGSVSMTAQWWLDVREPKKEVVAAHLVNLCWNGLMHLEDDPQLLDE